MLKKRTFKVRFKRQDNSVFYRFVSELTSEDACIVAEKIGIEEKAIPSWPFLEVRGKSNRRPLTSDFRPPTNNHIPPNNYSEVGSQRS